MFFSITNKNIDKRFFISHKLDNWYVNLDSGWKIQTINDVTVLYKGYCDTHNLDDIINIFVIDSTPRYDGNFCVIMYADNNFCITHDVHRKFPIWNYNSKCITNLSISNEKFKYASTVLNNSFLEIQKTDKFIAFDTYIKAFSNVLLELVRYQIITINDQRISNNNCYEYCLSTLYHKVNTFTTSTVTKKVFLSGGFDTMLVYSLLAPDNESNLLFVEHKDEDDFLLYNRTYLDRNHSFYTERSYHHWSSPTFLTSGAGAGYSFLREYYIVSAWCAYNNINFIDIYGSTDLYRTNTYTKGWKADYFKNNWNCRHYIQEKYPTYAEFCNYIITLSMHNYQHHHIGHTIFWTPLQDINITKSVLSLDIDSVMNQILYGNLENYIISYKDEQLLSYISNKKNQYVYENMKDWEPFKRISNE